MMRGDMKYLIDCRKRGPGNHNTCTLTVTLQVGYNLDAAVTPDTDHLYKYYKFVYEFCHKLRATESFLFSIWYW